MTKYGQIKRVERKEFTPWRTYKSKSTKYAKLKDAEDVVITISPVVLDDIMLMTEKGYALRFNIEEVPIIGAKARCQGGQPQGWGCGGRGLYQQYELCLSSDPAW